MSVIIRACPKCHGTGKIQLSSKLEAFGFKVAQVRNAKGFTQVEVANAMHMTRTSIANIEGGKQNLPIDKVYTLAEVLGVDVFDLL